MNAYSDSAITKCSTLSFVTAVFIVCAGFVFCMWIAPLERQSNLGQIRFTEKVFDWSSFGLWAAIALAVLIIGRMAMEVCRSISNSVYEQRVAFKKVLGN
jgi:hypothetical protein